MNFLRRLRGLVGISLTWAVLWVPLGWLASVVDAVARGRPVEALFWSDVRTLMTIGAICGFLFGMVLAAAAKRKTFEQLTLGRTALWGVAAGMVIPGVFAVFNGIGAALSGVIGYGAVCAVAAMTTLAVAKRGRSLEAPAPRQELPPTSTT